jgi:phosphoadenosine phosphosulfate reductase
VSPAILKKNQAELNMNDLDIATINKQLSNASPQEIVAWALSLGKKTITTTSFSPNSAVMLNLIAEQDKTVPVVWVDTGYNTRDTYVVAEKIMQGMDLNMHIFSPLSTSARRDATMGIPSPEDELLHKEFSRQVKLEPFSRAIDALAPAVWLTGLRREETAFRKTLDIVSWDSRGILKVAPIFHFNEDDVEDYMQTHELPTCKRYFDPTKVADNQECGLHNGP